MANDNINHFIATDLAANKIAFHHCPKHDDKLSPNTFIILNAKTGTRTILHTNLGLFYKIPVDDFPSNAQREQTLEKGCNDEIDNFQTFCLLSLFEYIEYRKALLTTF